MQRYGDLMVFKIAAIRHLGFLKFKFFNGQSSQETHLASPYQLPNFVKIGQTVVQISQFFVIFKMAAAAILDFQKFDILTVIPLYVASVRHQSKFRHNPSNGCRDMAI